MPHADPSRMWEPADDLDRILYDVWCKALDASNAKDQQEEVHDCSVCGDSHGRLDEARYVDMQRAYLTNARSRDRQPRAARRHYGALSAWRMHMG